MSEKTEPQAGQFPATRLSLVERARGEGEVRRLAVGQLLETYQPALRAHLLWKRRISPDRAEDLVQAFITDKVIERNLVSHYDRTRGKFRTFLLTALDRYVSNILRNEAAQRRSPDSLRSLDDDQRGLAVSAPSTANPFDIEWANQVLKLALKNMQDECGKSGREDLWQIFDCRVRAPLMEQVEPLAYDEFVQRFGLRSPTQASNLLITAKRAFERSLRQVIAEYVHHESEIDEEIRDLIAVLAGA